MKLKKIILCILAFSILICACGCSATESIELNGVTYNKCSRGEVKCMTILAVGYNYVESNMVYIPDEANGRVVTDVGTKPIYGNSIAKIYGVEKVYFPWSIKYSPVGNIEYTLEVKYIISASTVTLIDTHHQPIFVIPRGMYNEPERDYAIRGVHTTINLTEESNILPANIAYFFNYEQNPNEGYFFVDLLEESGKITKPPYDPKREGYTFLGWYKEPECVNAWDFENDVVEIQYDEDGNRIYEEICLYAKWVEQ